MVWQTVKRVDKWKAEVEHELAEGKLNAGGTCGYPQRKHNDPAQGPCEHPAGMGTAHLGAGRCVVHGGNSKRENARGAWVMAHEMARALNVTPWEALLGEVRRTAGTVAWLDHKVAEAPNDESLLRHGEDDAGNPGYAPWVKMRLTERQHLARVSKMAVDAGVAQQLVAEFTLHGQQLAGLVAQVIAELGLPVEQETRAYQLLERHLLQIESTATADKVIDGETVSVPRTRG